MTKAKRQFHWEDQERFAALTGDYNPMHMDEVASRRTAAAAPVVHGMHTLLWSLDALAAQGVLASVPERLKVKFARWTYVGDEVEVYWSEEAGNPQRVRVEMQGMVVLTADLGYGDMAESAVGQPSPREPRKLAAERSFAELENLTGVAFTASGEDAAAMFPALAGLARRGGADGGALVAELAACSYIVGMEAPGLHSMFSRLDVRLRAGGGAADPRTGVFFSVQSIDPRFRKGRIAVEGRTIAGILDVFVRQPPVAQPTLEEVSKQVQVGEFAGVRALIVGGSRGLGELTAKLLAAGGAERLWITYRSGKADAEHLVEELRGSGTPVELLAYDVREAAGMQLEGLNGMPTQLYYFATNPIFQPRAEVMSERVLEEFLRFYVYGFYELCGELRKRREASERLVAYYPSSVAVEERPMGLTEYAMAKAAGEQMCRDMNLQVPDLRIVSSRLPRLRTDQTATVVPEREEDSVRVLLAIVREMMRSK